MKPMRRIMLAALAAAVAGALPAGAQEKADVAAAEKEGKVVWYTSVDVKVAESVADAFRKAHPKIEVEVERSGSERVFQLVNQVHESGI
jgi:iron(III) transport system substrate-binding protein